MGVLPVLDRFSAPARIQRLSVFALGTVLIVLFLENTLFPGTSVTSLHRRADRSRSEYYQQWGSFEPMQIPGFVNTGLPGKRSCDTLKYNSSVGVQRSFHLKDDIKQIAMALDSHPVVDYPDEMMNDPDMRTDDIVEKTWARLSGSSVWLPEQKVFLSVTMVAFSPSRTRSVPKMSFLRGQIFNEDWEHLDNHTIVWSGKPFTFPTVFDIPAQWEEDGSLYGPEDPRIILEDNVEGVEPVIIFNMIGSKSDWNRAMYLFRPFSNDSTILTIKNMERAYSEKDWAPFFIPNEEQQLYVGKIPLPVPTVVRKPSEYIYFVYDFKPLRILKCHMRCGDCEFEFEQEVPPMTKHDMEGGTLRGGTNFVPVPIPSSMDIDPRVRVYAAFPQTNIEKHCDGRFYRPEFVVMINIGKQFTLAFASESLDFSNAILEYGPEDNRCDRARILIPNSVARWDTGNGQDVMSVALSANDETIQVARLHGLLAFVRNLPQFKTLLKKDGLLKGADADLMSILSSWTGDDVRGCLVESTLNYTGVAPEIAGPRDEADDVDLSGELLIKLKQKQKQAAEAKGIKKFDNGIGRGYNPGVPTLEHPPADEDVLWHPELLGEFEDVEGLPVDGLLEEEDIKDDKQEDGVKKADEVKKQETTEEGKKEEATKEEEKKQEEDKKDEPEKKQEEDKKDEPEKVEEEKKEEEKKVEEKKPDNPPKAEIHGHHRYHKVHQNGRRMWP